MGQPGRRLLPELIALQGRIDDETYFTVFETMIEVTSIVLQCGVDSLRCDRIGTFQFLCRCPFAYEFNIPPLVLGCGGYTIKSWTYKTAMLVGAEMPDELPTTVKDPFFRDSQ